MKLLTNAFKTNPYIIEPEWTVADTMVLYPTGTLESIKDIEFIRPLLSYQDIKWNIETDFFQYLEPDSLYKLRHDKCVLIFDVSLEGFSFYEIPFAMCLHKLCNDYKIDHRKIFLLTANYKEIQNYNVYRILNKFNQSINIVQTMSIGLMTTDQTPISLEESIALTKKNHIDKIILQLSRRNRPYRVLANYYLSQTEFRHRALISQDVLTDEQIHHVMYEYRNSICQEDELSIKDIIKWNKELPYVVDSSDFGINWASHKNKELYDKTIFSVVLETSQNDYGETKLFPSEKTYKAINARHPFIILGNKNINRFLRTIGFKTYEQYFDLDMVEDDVDPLGRYKKIISQLEYIMRDLSKRSIQARVDWKFMDRDLLEHNYQVLVSKKIIEKEAQLLHSTIYSYFNNNFKDYLSTNNISF